MNIDFTPEEMDALRLISQEKGLSPQRLVVQALRLYQLVNANYAEFEPVINKVCRGNLQKHDGSKIT